MYVEDTELLRSDEGVELLVVWWVVAPVGIASFSVVIAGGI
jgi:hypothetical protein